MSRISPQHIHPVFIWSMLTLCAAFLTSEIWATIRAPTPPLEERVKAAETVFVGKLINKVVEGDWVRAELLIEEPLKNSEKGAKVLVIWRATLGGRPIYDTPEDSEGIAILGDKHEGRYWLRDDKFEPVGKLDEE